MTPTKLVLQKRLNELRGKAKKARVREEETFVSELPFDSMEQDMMDSDVEIGEETDLHVDTGIHEPTPTEEELDPEFHATYEMDDDEALIAAYDEDAYILDVQDESTVQALGELGMLVEVGDKVKIHPKMLKKESRTHVKEMKTDTVTFYSWAAPALINADSSGLSDEEEREVDEFEQWLKKNYGRNAYVTMDDGDSYFGRPDTGGLKGDVVDYTVIY